MAKIPHLEPSGSSVSSESLLLDDLSVLDENKFQVLVDFIGSVCTFQQQWHLHHVIEKSLSRDFLGLLPPEIAFKILGYLDVEDLLRGLQVSRKWRQLITEATPVWKAVAIQHGPSHLLAEELRFRLTVPIYDLLKGGTETDIQQKPYLFQARITWKECTRQESRRDHHHVMHQSQTAVIGNKVYVGGYFEFGRHVSRSRHTVISYSLSDDVWNTLPDCPVIFFGMGQLEGRVVAIGGRRISDNRATNEVYVLDEDSQSWKDSIIPPMPTPCLSPAVLSHHSFLIVAGGDTPSGRTSVVELFRRDTSQWHRTCPLPFPCYNMSSVVIQNTAYLLGEHGRGDYSDRVVYASVDSLLQKSLPPGQTSELEDSDSVWKTLPNTPCYGSAAATISGCLLAVGGEDKSKYGSPPQKEVYIYSPSTTSWLHVSDLPSPQRLTTIATISTATISPTEFLVITHSHRVFKVSLEIH